MLLFEKFILLKKDIYFNGIGILLKIIKGKEKRKKNLSLSVIFKILNFLLNNYIFLFYCKNFLNFNNYY